jgi:hypothetical protein
MIDVNVSRKVAEHLKEITKNRLVIMRFGEEGALNQKTNTKYNKAYWDFFSTVKNGFIMSRFQTN